MSEVLPPNHYAPEGEQAPSFTLEQQDAAQQAGMSVEEFTQQNAEQSQEPEDKYAGKTVEQVIEMHKEAERRISELGQPAPQEQAQEAEGEPGAFSPSDVTSAIQEAAAYFSQHNSLTEEHVDALEKAGVPRESAASFVQAGIDSAELTAIRVFEITGSEDGYTSMLGWMRKHVDASELAKFDAALDSGKRSDILEATNNMWARFQADGGGPPKLISGEIAQLDGVKPFASDAEMVAAMSDPRYSGPQRDPAYVKSVEARIAAGT